MRIKSIMKNLFGSEEENQQSSTIGNEEKEQPKSNLGKKIKEEDKDSIPNNDTPPCEEKKEDNGSPKEEKSEQAAPAISTYNLIILDESGSMSGVRYETISGCNETLNSIRNTAKEQKEIKQYVSIFCFDTTNSRYIFHDVPVEETRDLTRADYCPNACTPLYDAIGYTVTQLSKLLANTESVGIVTIITDGYENASRRWSHHMVVELIESLKKRGWVFTFIGANIDVETTATGLGIDSRMKFEQTSSGLAEMFKTERLSRRAYSAKMNYMRNSRFFKDESEERRRQDLGAMNQGFFIEEERIAPDFVNHLADGEVFVFFSNIDGQHDSGASLYAKEHFGAINGQAEGMQGRSYAIPMVGNSFEEFRAAVERFNEYVVRHPDVKFMLTSSVCAATNYSIEMMARLFRMAYSFGNVYVPKQFLPYM